MKTLTLSELGPNLPIGIVTPEGLVKTFTLRPLKTKQDRLIGLWKEANQTRYTDGQHLACMVAKFLSLIVESAGDTHFPLNDDGDSSATTELNFHKWFFADVMYAYIYARVQNLGSILTTSVVCPNERCSFKSDRGQFDLNTMTITVAEKVEELSQWVDLIDPYPSPDGREVYKRFKLEPVLWSTMTRPGVIEGSPGQIDLATLQDSVKAVNKEDRPVRMTETDLDEMSRRDFLNINQIADQLAGGVDLRTRIECPKCGGWIVDSLRWDYDYFFGTSFRLENLKSSEKTLSC